MIFQRDVIKSGEIVSVVGSHITIRFILYERRSKNIIKDTINRVRPVTASPVQSNI